MPDLRIICESHLKPVNVGLYVRRATGEWEEQGAYSAERRREYNRREQLDSADPLPVTEDDEDYDIAAFVERVRPEPDRRRTQRLRDDKPVPRTAYGEAVAGLPAGDDSEYRNSHPVKCPGCEFGSWRRAENLGPVLELIHQAGQREVTLEAFWTVANRWDDTRKRATGD